MRIRLSLLILYSILAFAAKAQLCSGSLGDPIINQTFSAGHSFLMPPNSTTYIKGGGCPAKGEYVNSNFIFGCGNNNDKTWVAMIGDHTGDYNGNYMLVNAESTPGTVYVDTAKNLCPGTNYVFSAWVTNVMQNISCEGKPILANLTMTIKKLDGTILASTTTGDIPVDFSKAWMQYGTSFICPPNTPTVIVSVTTSPRPGCGSGFAIDDITFRSCGPKVSVTLDGSAGPGNVCADYTAPFLLQGTFSPGIADPVVQWQHSMDTGKTWVDISGANAFTYAVPRRMTGVINYRMIVAERSNVNSVNCRIASNSIYTEIHPVPLHNPPQNFTGCLDKDLALPGTDPKALSILWNGPNGYTSTLPASVVPNVQYRDTGLYVLRQNFYFGCSTIDSFYLKIYPSTTITALPANAVCEGVSQQLSVSASGGGTFTWYPATGLSNANIPNPIATPKDSTEYKVIVTNTFGCKDSAFVTIDVYRNLNLSAGPDKVILTGDTATLTATVTGTAVSYLWSPNTFMIDSDTTTPKVFPTNSMEYTLTARSDVGCGIASDKVWVNVYDELKIPNAFTPNGDGLNDIFRFLPLDNYKLVYFEIFNRFGQLIFKTSDIQQGWDGTYKGKIQSTGTYTYRLEMVNNKGGKINRKGTVTLLQ